MLKAIRIILIIFIIITSLVVIMRNVEVMDATTFPTVYVPEDKMWEVQSIDTMKYSRDLAREKLWDTRFDAEIKKQVNLIAQTGATHVAIDTPYDQEFVPFLTKWVTAVRDANLNVWFRGNLSGWEQWFGYKRITPADHIQGITEFITNNPDLFEDGDIFTPCPECENGSIGDPRQTRKVDYFRSFLITEHEICDKLFEDLGKNVKTNYASMNGDVASMVMDHETISKLDNLVTVDHYVPTAQELKQDLTNFSTGEAQIALSEIGAPIPDIHGKMTEGEQAGWLDETLNELSQIDNLVAINYWTNLGGSTGIWNLDLSPRQAVGILSSYFQTKHLYGYLHDEFYRPITNTRVSFNGISVQTDENGYYELPVVLMDKNQIEILVDNYNKQSIVIDRTQTQKFNIRLVKKYKTIAEKFLLYFNSLIIKIRL